MNAYLVTIPITLTEEQREAVDGFGWRVAADLRNDVMAAAVPTTVIEVSADSPEQAADVVARAFGVDPGEARVEEREEP
jgi:predicted GNAT superfamily acetyltransferase